MGVLSEILGFFRPDTQTYLVNYMLKKSKKIHNSTLLRFMICRNAIIYRLRKYGFSEVAVLMDFLKLFCDDVPDRASYLYIKEKLKECLDIHDNGGDYFSDMHRVVLDVEHVISTEGPML